MAEVVGHESVQLIKLDIEGAEWDVVPLLLSEGPLPEVLCFELHFGNGRTGRDAVALVAALRGSGYECVAYEQLNLTFVRNPERTVV